MNRFALASVAVAVAVLSAGAASANDYRLVYGDLDLGSIDGAARFDLRVGRAARAACSTGDPLFDSRCRAEFRTEAMRLLPEARRDDYARGRDMLFSARASINRR